MSLRSEYEAAKRKYHKTGETLFKSKGASRVKARTEYIAAHREYEKLGMQLRKKGR